MFSRVSFFSLAMRCTQFPFDGSWSVVVVAVPGLAVLLLHISYFAFFFVSLSRGFSVPLFSSVLQLFLWLSLFSFVMVFLFGYGIVGVWCSSSSSIDNVVHWFKISLFGMVGFISAGYCHHLQCRQFCGACLEGWFARSWEISSYFCRVFAMFFCIISFSLCCCWKMYNIVISEQLQQSYECDVGGEQCISKASERKKHKQQH